MLRAHKARAAVDTLDAFRKMDARPRTLTIASAGHLIDAYEYESVQCTDRHDFTPEKLLEQGGTLHLVAPEGRQDMIGPPFAALLRAVPHQNTSQRRFARSHLRRRPVVSAINGSMNARTSASRSFHEAGGACWKPMRLIIAV